MQHFRRFLSKLAFDIAPAAIASIIGAFLFTHHYTQPPPATPVAAAPPENEQLIEMVRDEHKLLVQYFKTEQAKEQAIREQEAREKKEAAAVQRSTPQPRPLPERKASIPAEVSGQQPAEIALGRSAPVVAGSISGQPAPAAVQPVPTQTAPKESSPIKFNVVNFADKALDMTHIKDLISLVRDVSGWFTPGDERPIPPGVVRSHFEIISN